MHLVTSSETFGCQPDTSLLILMAIVVEMDNVKKPPACGGNGTTHTADTIEDGHDTIPPLLTRIHTTTPTYSHQYVSARAFSHMSAHERHGGTRPTPSLASVQPGTTPGPGPTDRAPARSSPGLPTPPHPLGPPGAARTNTWRIRAPRLGPARDRPGGRRRRLQRSENATRTAATGAAHSSRFCGRAGRP